MDIRVFIRKGTVYAATITSLAIVFALIAPPLARAAGYEHERIPLLWASIVAVALAILFQPLKHHIQRYMNRYVYRETYDFQQTVRELSRTLNTILDFTSLLRYLAAAVERIFQCEVVRIYLLDPPSGIFINRTSPSVAFDPEPAHLNQLSSSSPLVACLRDRRRSLVREEALRTAMNAPLAAADQLHALGGEIALPLADEQTLSGFLVVGPKKSGDPYFAEDLDLLSTFMSQATTALKNAQLYRQVVFVNEYIENILRIMDSGVITIDAQGKVALFNSTAERLTGLSKAALTSLTIDQLPRSLASPLRATLSDGQPRPQVEGVLSRDAHRRIPVVCSTSALRDDRDLVVGALIVFNDLTQVKALESEKRRAERLAAFGTLVSGIAHEIKNPLVAIRTFAELLPDRFSETDFREDFSKVVITEIDRIDRLVSRLRGLAVPSVQHVATIDIREPVNETLALLRGQLEQTRTGLHREFLDSKLLVSVDPSQLKQLFLNLFLNAIEAMGVGGQLTVRVRRRQVDNGTWIAAEVLDSGPGIDESIRAHIFDPFFTTKPRGSGLGLAICRGIMDAHRGTIRAENNPEGVGTTIVVEFPAVSEEAGLLETKTVST
jgi:PAS domain S-box-containing protein